MATSRLPRDLEGLSRDEVKNIFKSIDTVLVDCDGVMWLGNTPLPGSLDVIKQLRQLGKKVFFVSNNCTLTPQEYRRKFSAVGLDVDKDDIILPSVVVCSYLKAQGFQKKAYVIGSQAFVQTLKESGIQVVDDYGELKEETIRGLIATLDSLDLETGAVVIDFDPKMTYMKLMNAAILLKRCNPIFIVGATDYDVPVTEDVTLIGPGYFISMLETRSEKKPVIAGKPSPVVIDVISQRHPLVPERTLMIGDSIPQDIKMGNNCGLNSLLVLSGISKEQDVTRYPDNQPTYYISTLGKLLPLLQ